MVFHSTGNMEGRVGDSVHSHFDLTLLNIFDCIFDSLGHFESMHYDRQSASSKSTHSHFLARCKTLSAIYDSHLVEFLCDLLSLGNPVLIILLQSLQLSN